MKIKWNTPTAQRHVPAPWPKSMEAANAARWAERRAELVAKLSKLETLCLWLRSDGTLEERNSVRKRALEVEAEIDALDKSIEEQS